MVESHLPAGQWELRGHTTGEGLREEGYLWLDNFKMYLALTGFYSLISHRYTQFDK